MADHADGKSSKVFLGVMAGLGGAFGIWAMMAFITGLASTNWQVTEMVRSFLVATNNIGEYETLVDFYTHIKGVEYLMAAAFFVAFPIYFKYVNNAPAAEASQARVSR